MAAEFYDLKLSGIIQETPDARSFVFEVPEALRERFAYRAGQFLTFEIPWNGMQLRRCYSLASAPETDSWHKVTVKRVDGGRISNWFNDQLQVGSTVRVQPPEGRFVLREKEQERPLLLFGGGSGITPVISLAKSALVSTARKVKLVYANRDRQSIIFRDELTLLFKSFPERFEVVHHLDSDRGFLTKDGIRSQIGGYEAADVYTCGPTPFMDAVEAALDEVRVPVEHRHFERFVSPVDPDRRTDEAPAPTPSASEVPASFTMTFEGKTHQIPYKPGLTLLQACEAAGHKPPSSCEDGYCGCCMAMMRSGKVAMKSREALSDHDIERGWVLACQSRPTSSEELALDFDATY
jgi:3-ketosteroid 9alpha-monooxygenase subunit B